MNRVKGRWLIESRGIPTLHLRASNLYGHYWGSTVCRDEVSLCTHILRASVRIWCPYRARYFSALILQYVLSRMKSGAKLSVSLHHLETHVIESMYCCSTELIWSDKATFRFPSSSNSSDGHKISSTWIHLQSLFFFHYFFRSVNAEHWSK